MDLDSAAAEMSNAASDNPLWSILATTELDQLHETWRAHFDALEAGTLGAASHTRVIGPDLELVLLVDPRATNPAIFDEPTLLTDAFVFTVRMNGEGWQVAAYGDHLPTSGWPPVLGQSTG